jgi:hypothetical protein
MRPLTRTQALQNRAFLKLLRKTNNVRLACRELGLKYGTMQHRRRVHPGFALRWEAALVFAAASFDRLRMDGRTRVGPSAGRARCSPLRPFAYKTGKKGRRGGDARTPLTPLALRASRPSPARGEGLSYRTVGGEPVIVRTRHGRLQMRRALPGKITREGEQAYLAAISATCNKSLAAAAVGASFAAFNRRARKDPAFARELRMAMAQGYEALDLALLEGLSAYSHEHDEWRHNEPPAMPPMSVSQALQLMYLHQKEALLGAESPFRGNYEEGEEDPSTSFAGSPPLENEGRIMLPDLAQVTGWSRAEPTKAAHHGERALFGGWRIEDMALRQAQDERRKRRGGHASESRDHVGRVRRA